ncbi:tetratricopeptide repeat protein [Gemmobacter serpentinus]|uniref:tetratricopeptide repeat protein n=1 Tax=Gemmobacter serpentinus TaxID=2652247 RepID=UPI00124CD280|nr:tetratricopeptide repeat protein [Gemmobacter serpentinus]
MRHSLYVTLCLTGMAVLAGCNRGPSDAEVKRAVKDVNVVDESNLGDIMLTVGDPNEAVNYFSRTLQQNPGRPDLQRGLAKSLMRAGKPEEAARTWSGLVNSHEGTNEDRVGYAEALIRANKWPEAEAELAKIPPTHETYDRYRLEAMVADSKKQWKKADSFYEIAAGLTAKPASVLNNWGFSKMNRGEYAASEKLFIEALGNDPTMFTAKNNLVMARGAQRKYDLPVIEMTQTERAELLYTLGLTAVKQGDVSTGRNLLEEAVETHPQYFEAAARSLEALKS